MAKTKAQNPEKVLDDLLSSLGELPGVIGKMGDVVQRLVSSVVPLVSALDKLAAVAAISTAEDTVIDKPSSSENLSTAASDRNTVAVSRLTATVDRLIALMTNTALPVLPRATPVSPGSNDEEATGAKGGLGGLGRLAAVGAVAAAAIGILAVSVSLAQREFQKLESFVRLFNPATIEIFHQALNNLGATIGRLFVPVFQVATQLVRQYTQSIAGLVEKMAPVVQKFSETFGGILSGVIQTFAGLLRSITPVLAQFAQWIQLGVQMLAAYGSAISTVIRGVLLFAQVFYELSGLGTIVRILTRVFEGMSEVMRVVEEAFSILEVTITTILDLFVTLISSLFPVTDFMNRLTQAIQFVIRNMYVMAVQMARLAGLFEVADALIASVEARLKTGDTAAQSPQIKSLEQLAKDLALASASAGAGAGQSSVKNQQEFWQKTLDEMRAARNNGLSIQDLLKEILKAIGNLNPLKADANVPNPEAGPGGLPNGFIGGIASGTGVIGKILRGGLAGVAGQ